MRRRGFLVASGIVGMLAVSALWAQQPPRPIGPQVRPIVIPRGRPPLQRVFQRQVGDDGFEAGDGYAFREDRETLTILRKASELRDQKRYAEAVEALGRLLEGSEDHFIKPVDGENLYRSAKTEARKALGEMPAEGRESYELQFGALARRKLEEAAAKGDIDGVAEVARQFFHTRAGYEAMFLLGMHHADHGRSQAAVHVWRSLAELDDRSRADFEPLLSLLMAKSLLESGQEQEAVQVAVAARDKYRDVPIELAGERLPWFEGSDGALGWLRQLAPDMVRKVHNADWTLFRGGPARNEPSQGSTPLLSYRWRVPTANDDPAVERAIAEMHNTYRAEGLTTLPALQPLAVGDTILMRSARNLIAVDFRTGKRIWEVPTDNPFEQLPSSSSAGIANNFGGGRLPYGMDSSQGLYELLERRIWDDAVFGTMSSDGQLVFAVEPADADASAYAQQSFVFGAAGMRMQTLLAGTSQTNRLAAFDVKNGKLKWEIGGPKGSFPLEQAGSFFLGPPLPLFDKLYVLAESDGEMRLLALEPATGALVWSQQIAVGAQEFVSDQLPRVSGATPSYADGVLVCPTSAGAVVGIDLASRSLLWGVRYPRQLDPWVYGQNRNQQIQMNMYQGSRLGDAQMRWCDATVTLANGRVLLAPPDSDKLACRSLLTGELLWEASRGDGLYVACVDNDRVIVVGAKRVRSINLANGRDTWDADHGRLGEARPSGRGFYAEQRYYLPTTAGEVMTVDLQDGTVRTVARRMSSVGDSRSERSSLGNLICHRGSVLSHGAESLECFDQVDVLAERTSAILAATPDDPKALMRMGEIQLQRGEFAGAIASLSRAWDQAGSPVARRLLVEAYLTVMEQDFASVSGQLAEIEPLFQEPVERNAYLRLKAAGLEAIGDRVAAFAAYQELSSVETDAESEGLEALRPFWSVRRDRLVRGHLERLRKAASEAGDHDALAAMDQRVADAWTAAGGENASRDALEQYVAHYGGFDIAKQAKLRLAQLRSDNGEWLAAEIVLMDLEHDADAEVARHAWARHAQLLVNAGRADDAALYYERLVEEWSEVDCGEGKTGAQWLAALPPDHAVRKIMEGEPAFPIGRVDTNELQEDYEPTNLRTPVDLDGAVGPFYLSQAFHVGQTSQRFTVSLEDGLGNRQWELPLVDPKFPEMAIGFPNSAPSQGRVYGHFAVIATGYHLFGIDPLGDRGRGEARILWRADLNDPLPGTRAMMGISATSMPQRFAPPRNIALDQSQRRLGNTACLGETGLVYQRGRMLCCVSPLTGELLWTRDDLTAGSDLSGDGDVVVAIAPNTRQATLLDAVDGHDLGTREVALPKDRVTLLGRIEISWYGDRGDRECELRATDLVEDKIIWSQKFAGNSTGWVVDGDAMGVCEPQGAFKLIQLKDGKLLVNEQLEAPKKLKEILVLSSQEQYTLFVNETLLGAQRREFTPIPVAQNQSVQAQGKFYAFDRRTGKTLWQQPREVVRQGLSLRQPADLPVLVLLSLSSANGGGLKRQGNLLCIDKRTGREVYSDAFDIQDKQPSTRLAGQNGLQIIANAAAQTIKVATQGKTVELHFSGAPLPEEAPDAAGDLQAKRKKAGAGGILFSALKALGRASQDAADPFRTNGEAELFEEDSTAEGEMQFFEIIESEPLPEDLPPFDDDEETDDKDPFGDEETPEVENLFPDTVPPDGAGQE